MLRRSDALGTETSLVRQHAEDAISEVMVEEANEQFECYRAEVGTPDPPRRKGRVQRPA